MRFDTPTAKLMTTPPPPTPPSFHPSPSKPHLRLPPGACDAHCHVFGPAARFPFAKERTFTPADAPKEKLFALHALLGIERCVIVQSGCHGFDNSATEDAIAAKDGTYLGVALLPTSVDEAELRRLDRAGFRGIRFNFIKHLGAAAPIQDVIALSSRLAELGWHLQIHCESALIGELGPSLKRSSVPVVIDHIGRVDASLGLDQPAFRNLLELMRDSRFWVKVSGSERASRRPPPYEDAIPFARKLVSEFGDRVLWGTDWPHPNFAGEIPDDGVLVDLLAEIAPADEQRKALLVDNPQRLYKFPAAR
jgi:2-pyrone-4,6-dicarboxylate lactonase